MGVSAIYHFFCQAFIAGNNDEYRLPDFARSSHALLSVAPARQRLLLFARRILRSVEVAGRARFSFSSSPPSRFKGASIAVYERVRYSQPVLWRFCAIYDRYFLRCIYAIDAPKNADGLAMPSASEDMTPCFIPQDS